MFTSFIDFINNRIFGPGLCIAVFASGISLIFILKAFFIRKPCKIVKSLFTPHDDSGLSPVKAMLVALAGTLGVGNIAGVASAIAIGGAGAVFWMIVSAVAALPIKYSEIVLAVRHRRCDPNKKYHGGAYFYIEDRKSRFSPAIAVIFAILCLSASLTMGCATQANAIAVSAKNTFGMPSIICGVVLGLLTLFTASGGLSRISFVTTRLIPVMSGIYILMCLFVIFSNLPIIGEILGDIFSSAFAPEAAAGGIIGFITSRSLRIGVTRGIVSNEAGCGTAPIAHASAAAASPAAQGIWGIFEVFIDTIVMCSLTAFTVLIAEKRGVLITSDGTDSAIAAFGKFIPFSDVILCAAIAVFAFCTVICWFYYAEESLSYLCRNRPCKFVKKLFLLIYSSCAVFGSVMSADIVWSLSDLTVSAMTALNIFMVLMSIKEVKCETDIWLRDP